MAFTTQCNAMCFTTSNYYTWPTYQRAVYVAGNFTAVDEYNRKHIVRLSRSGYVDPDFVSGTGFARTAGTPVINCLCEMPSQQVLVGGHFDSYRGTTTYHLAILDPDGSIAVAFNPGPNNGAGATLGTAINSIIKVGSDYYITGDFTHFDSDELHQVARIDSSGAAVLSFDTSAGPGSHDVSDPDAQTYFALTLEAGTERVLAVGDGYTGLGTPGIGLALYNDDGTVDASFGTNTLLSSGAADMRCCATQEDGKYIIGGSFSAWDSDTARRRLVRLEADGTLDTGFNPLIGSAFNPSVRGIGIQQDGYIIIVGGFTGVWGVDTKIRQNLCRLGPTGEVEGIENP